MPPRARKSSTAIEGVIVDQAVLDEAPVKEWGAATLNGRSIAFNAPNPAQLIVLRRLSRKLDMAKTEGEKFFLVAQILDAVSALMMSDDDRNWADLEVLEGRADLDRVIPLMIAAITGSEGLANWEAREEQPKPRRVRRARS